ncbi:Pyoverdine/dityrosine biosynthesis protein-domain-containing protein [Xylariomycetidae sp. FL2044]|nr:Pyoverdine/dityrosine biosynthesis protein-domain-containing protein [Xylariomycetidae sp. FL2044]
MAPSSLDRGSSPFHSVLALFCRDDDGRLLSVEGREASFVSSNWTSIYQQLRTSQSSSVTLPSGRRVNTSCVDVRSPLSSQPLFSDCRKLRIREIYRGSARYHVGVLCKSADGNDQDELLDWIETMFILKTTLAPQIHPLSEHDIPRHCVVAAENIAAIFETTLRNISPADEWNSSGRECFYRQILDFVVKNETCQMILPAFPCKSPNELKVGSRKPDLAERIALETIHTFVQRVREVYPPGATIWIIHDGHLFSNCIGVDDAAVSEYEADLQNLYRSTFTNPLDQDSVKFCGLAELFFSEPDLIQTFAQRWLTDLSPPYQHPFPTRLDKTVETARHLVEASCGIDRSHLRALIQTQDPEILGLYRGQSRFMLHDLSAPSFLSLSTSKRKKLASVVALEMIARNQAYSNLLQLLFPNYVRLSIHAHPNRGPKFAIRLFPKDKVRAVDDLRDRHEAAPVYEFQIPTPWHSSIIKVDGDKLLYLAKASVAREAMVNGTFRGGWLEPSDGEGHYALRDTARADEPPIVSAAEVVGEEPAERSLSVKVARVVNVWMEYSLACWPIYTVVSSMKALTQFFIKTVG